MRFRALCLLLISCPSLAQHWQISPQVCTVTQANSPCVLQLLITTDTLVDEPSCVFRSDVSQALICTTQILPSKKIKLSLQLNKAIQVEIRTLDGRELASQTIDYAIYKPVTTRRRRGLGWNLL